LAFYLLATLVHSQNPLVKIWDARFGGNSADELRYFQQTKDHGYILAGGIFSGNSYDVTEFNHGLIDFWIVKLDPAGNKQWDKIFGGNNSEYINYLQETSDNGYILGGYTSSDSAGDVSQISRGYTDYWVVKTDSFGNKQWDKRYGGSNGDFLYCLRQTIDGGYILGGYTSSDTSGEVSHQNHGGSDIWIIKTDALGNIEWEKLYGGNLDDRLFDVQQNPDGSYILGGRTWSDSTGDVSHHNRGDEDYWILKIDSVGNKKWDNVFGGNYRDWLFSLQKTVDGGYILGGYTYSDSGGDVTEPTKGCSDFWVVKVDSSGNKKWDKRYGGNLCEDEFGYLRRTFDGGYLLSGTSYSPISGDKTEDNLGMEQSWIIKIDSVGGKVWDKTIFTIPGIYVDDESGYAIQSDDGCYVVANYTGADTGGYKTEMSRGSWDYWIVKFCDTTFTEYVNELTDVYSHLITYPNPFSSQLTIKFNDDQGEKEIILYDVTGQAVLRQITYNAEIMLNTEKLQAGIYIINYKTAYIKILKCY
jgi:hypothetical protein